MMLFSHEIRKKLSALRRQSCSLVENPRNMIAPESTTSPTDVSSIAANALEYDKPTTCKTGVQLPSASLSVNALFSGRERKSEIGLCYVMGPDVASIGGKVAELREGLNRAAIHRGAFLDIETAGLSGMPVFLVGLLIYEFGELTITQILARDYPEEAPLLEATARALEEIPLLFTYNGTTFDLPYLRQRALYHAIDWRLEAEHVDLLKFARARFRDILPDCRLQTLERHFCGRIRADDLPAAEIPRCYQEFVRTQNGRLLENVIRHNQLDLLTLAEIVPCCLG
ncbi:MAG: ribonuclease H-like domain-containing protein [Candidatus Zipacnadales bacterium]